MAVELRVCAIWGRSLLVRVGGISKVRGKYVTGWSTHARVLQLFGLGRGEFRFCKLIQVPGERKAVAYG